MIAVRPRLALFEPDMPGNLGAAMRLAACMEVGLDIVEPCGFPLDDRKLKRAAMDYAGRARLTRHQSFEDFHRLIEGEGRRLVLLTTQAGTAYHKLAYRQGDVLLLGRESQGVPDEIHAAADLAVRIPLAPSLRSLNVVVAAGMVLGEALRQLDAFPQADDPADN